MESINAVTLATRDMGAAVGFFEALGLELTFGGKDAAFSTLGLGGGDNTFHVNLFKPQDVKDKGPIDWEQVARWGRAIVYVGDVDAMYARAVAAGFQPEFAPRDAPWGERFFHIRDPSGHEISFAKKIEGHPFWDRRSKL